MAHTMISFRSLLKGLGKLIVNEKAITADLEKNAVVIAEAIQTILRREGVLDAYEQLKELTRTGSKMSGDTYKQFIDGLDVEESVKRELFSITPSNYIGI